MRLLRCRDGDRFTDPFARPYFADALRAAAELAGAGAQGAVGHYAIVRQIEGPHATVLVGRRQDGGLLVLKGYRPGPAALAAREGEALLMLRFGFAGIVPLEETLSPTAGGPITYLCMPYCQGGSLRDLLTAGQPEPAEAAFHGLALIAALERLHLEGLVHGDVKPDNLLFHHGDDGLGAGEARWHTWLSDLELVSPAGGATSWRMTPEYAAPEQLAGAPAAPAMDVWAWGLTMRDCFDRTGPLPTGWRWLAELVDRAVAVDPGDRPTAAQIVAGYERQVGFGDHRWSHLGAPAATATVRYPLVSMPPFARPWAARESSGPPAHFVSASFGWAARLPECTRLYELHSTAALVRLVELSSGVLGDPADPASVWQAFRRLPGAPALPLAGEGAITVELNGRPVRSEPGTDLLPRQAALDFVRHLATALVELVEETGAVEDLARLRQVAEAWESIGEFGSEADTAILAQAWLTLDASDRALPYVRRAYAADPSASSALAAMRLQYVVNGDHGTAARVALVGARTGDQAVALRWLIMSAVDLLEAADYDALDATLERLRDLRVDVLALICQVAAGRRGRLRAGPEWPALREHFSTISSTSSIQQLRYLVEAAFRHGEVDHARRCAAVALTRPTVRLPLHHRDRAAFEVVALGLDPAERSLTARLEHRAELWSAAGRPADPLVGLDLVAAERWVRGPGRAHASAAVLALVDLSRPGTGTTDRSARYCAQCQAPGRVGRMSVCGSCHRLFCARCARAVRPEHAERCGGDLAHPLPAGG
ncbi:protein kinase [Kitasatospora sp. NPDC002040]|uniref:protein kinase domain-containing protein n=1 Tax=Kitasatospora sp. NPDC002040 TaxID=3154661 RepID=UPI003326106E